MRRIVKQCRPWSDWSSLIWVCTVCSDLSLPMPVTCTVFNFQGLVSARKKEVETESHLLTIAEREEGRLKQEIKKLEKELEDLKEKKNVFEVGLRTSKMYNEPLHEIMVFFVLRKLILQKGMHNHPVGLDAWFLLMFTSILNVCEQRRLWRDCAYA